VFSEKAVDRIFCSRIYVAVSRVLNTEFLNISEHEIFQ